MNAIHIRWMIRRDMPRVLDIERLAFEFPWDEDDFVRTLRQRNCIAMVAERSEQVLGYMIYELQLSSLEIITFAVDPGHWREGVGRQLMDKLKSKLSLQRRRRIKLNVRDSNLPAQLFFRAQGFRAVAVLPNFYWFAGEACEDDAYVLEHLHAGEDQPIHFSGGTARCST